MPILILKLPLFSNLQKLPLYYLYKTERFSTLDLANYSLNIFIGEKNQIVYECISHLKI
jgi:hypothetical protein